MKHIKKSVLLWYDPREIYELVIDVASYPQFLPWCASVDILERDEHGLTARLHLAYSGVRQAFTTRNVQVTNESVHIALVDGPFSTLDGFWRFVPLLGPGSAEGGIATAACKVEFEMRYAFSNVVLEAAISPVFDRIANTLVDSFVSRAEQVHGPR